MSHNISGTGTQASPMTVSIIIVNYNGGQLLTDCLESVLADPYVGECEILVIDNASNDGSASEARRRFPAARIIETGTNAGFGAGNNIGIKECKGRYIFLLNPDTELAGGGLESMVRFMEEHPSVGLAGCRVLNSDRSIQHTIRNYPSLTNELFECFYLQRLSQRITKRLAVVIQDPCEYEEAHEVPWVRGCAMFVRREVIEQVCGFDERFFLYAEEIDLCRRITNAGWRIAYCPDLEVIHHEGASGVDPALHLEFQRGKLTYFAKHNGAVRLAVYRLIILARLCLRTATWIVVAAVGRTQISRRRLAAYWGALVGYPRLMLGGERVVNGVRDRAGR